MRHSALLRALSRCLAIAAATHLLACDLYAQPNHTKPPFAPWAVNLPEIGRIRGTITPCVRKGDGEEFAKSFYPVGDVNNDGLADWIVSRDRCDTVIQPVGSRVFETTPIELLLYHGLPGRIPAANLGVRIGPAEGDGQTQFLAAGDFDADGNRDLAIVYELLLDSSDGNTTLGHHRQVVTCLWGDGTGRFAINDTSRLDGEANAWLNVLGATASDIDGNGVDDLALVAYGGFTNGKTVVLPKLRIFRGERGVRWGQRSRQAEWRLWSVPSWNRFTALDQDCDGSNDLIFYADNNAGPSRITIYYGRRGALPDTSDFQVLEPIVANGRAALFSDVTGDGSPELLLNCGSHQSVKIFAGRPGQRLLEQYGSGLEPPTAGRGWWGRPWAEIWEPSRLNSSWSLSAGYAGFFELGDISTDGIDEIWIHAEPYVLG